MLFVSQVYMLFIRNVSHWILPLQRNDHSLVSDDVKILRELIRLGKVLHPGPSALGGLAPVKSYTNLEHGMKYNVVVDLKRLELWNARYGWGHGKC